MQYPKHSKEMVSEHFSVSELRCPCDECSITLVDPELVRRLERMRGLLGGPLRINSGYRCENYQHQLRLRGYETAIGVSQHTLGKAADVMCAREILSGGQLERLAREAGFTSVGVGHSFVHCDLRPGVRRWEYKR
jgi:uncharacterized protein YcbK (DUF882 family)